ncbi:hypothetical protein HBH92_089930 [Parastagonospora nodorum]|nr:hypothetical protein HBH54_092940 [Parastagonospora nodorum]KAH4018882.1 hypothetical protein HBI13_127420 [Parastagonospora nodorum]KAH4028374.1 hypothetical protein HBI09_136120 [Parastagonospora nodorum]KAH4070437.1 hypothetical protein HBH50_083680 [Parastagonospora nodorum]KAH4159336.1 hypothetical protein HBH44_102750 [Parastagonospora nodorum]
MANNYAYSTSGPEHKGGRILYRSLVTTSTCPAFFTLRSFSRSHYHFTISLYLNSSQHNTNMRSWIATHSAVMVGATSTLLNATPRLLSRTPDCLLWPDQRSMLVVDSAEDSAVNGLPAQPYDIIFPSKVLPLLAIDLRASRRIAKATYACEAGQATLSSSPSRKLAICQDRANGHILIDAPMEKVLVPELYAHIVDGVELNGIYLGVENQTTWGFRYTPATCHANATLSTRDYYEVKLLGLPESKWDTAGYEVEFRGFLKVVSWF